MRNRTLAVLLSCLAALTEVAVRPAEAASLVQANGVTLAYEEHGSGEPLVLLHGFGACGSAWDPFIPALAARYRLIVVELRGHGASGDFEGPFLFEDSAGDLLALLDQLKLQRVHAMGISAGGMTLLHAAVREPARFEAMVVIGAAHHFPEQARAIMRGTPGNLPTFLREAFMACTTRGEPQLDAILQQFNGFKDNVEDIRLEPAELATIEARTLVVHGDRDEFFPVDIPTEVYAAIPEAELWIVPGGDHVPIYGPYVRGFLETTLRFLERVDAASLPAPAPTGR